MAALTLQRKLELAGDLAKVQPALRRLHIVKKPKKHGVRNVVLVSSVIVAVALVAVLVRRGRRNDTIADDGDVQVDSPTNEPLRTDGDLPPG